MKVSVYPREIEYIICTDESCVCDITGDGYRAAQEGVVKAQVSGLNYGCQGLYQANLSPIVVHDWPTPEAALHALAGQMEQAAKNIHLYLADVGFDPDEM